MVNLKVILHPTDFSPLSGNALRYGVEFARRFGARLIVLHVLEYAYSAISLAEEAVTDAENALQKVLSPSQKAGLDVEMLLVRGNPCEEILRLAREREVDLIVMGTHNRGTLEHALLGSTTEKVIRKAPCPVLTIRHPEHEFIQQGT